MASSPVLACAAPAPVFECGPSAPAVLCTAPVIDPVAPTPAATNTTPAPVIETEATTPAVTYTAPAPVNEPVAPAAPTPAVTCAIPSFKSEWERTVFHVPQPGVFFFGQFRLWPTPLFYLGQFYSGQVLLRPSSAQASSTWAKFDKGQFSFRGVGAQRGGVERGESPRGVGAETQKKRGTQRVRARRVGTNPEKWGLEGWAPEGILVVFEATGP